MIKKIVRKIIQKILYSLGADLTVKKLDPYAFLLDVKRYEKQNISLLGNKFTIVDSLSFYYSYREIFSDRIYEFKTSNQSPYIIDCGANVGTSISFFKSIYPNAKIVAFEADPKVYEVCRENISSQGLSDVELKNLALWDEETQIEFLSEGADAGRIDQSLKKDNIVRVKTAVLSQYITDIVDFLKIDIEGAELRVLQESRSLLKNVKNLFVEYHSFENQEQVLDQILNIISSAGFRYQLKTIFASANPYLAIGSNVGMDLQINIFAYKIE